MGTGSDSTVASTGAPPLDASDNDTTLPPPACGDGNVDPGEMCDDNNLLNSDGCNDACQVPGSELFFETWSDQVDNRCYDIEADGDDGFVIAGIAGVVQGDGFLFARGYDGMGDAQWTYVATGERSGGWNVSVAPEGDVVVGGFVDELGLETPWIVTLSSTGALDSAVTLATAGRVSGIAWGLDGEVYAAGRRQIDADDADAWVARLQPDVSMPTWEVAIEGTVSEDDEFFGLALGEANDTVYVVGRVTEGVSLTPFGIVAAYAMGTGDEEWTHLEPSSDGGIARFWGATVSHGQLAVAGASGSPLEVESWFGAFDKASPSLNVVVDGRASDDEAHMMLVDAEGYAFVSGYRRSEDGTQNDAYLRKYAPGGKTIVWEHELNEDGGNGDKAYGLAIADDGNLFACGYTSPTDRRTDVWVGRYAH